jgi:hypothetical protein
MTSPYKLFGTKPDLEVAGIVIKYGDEAWFKIARSGGGNKRYLTQMTERLKPYRRQIQTETMDEKLADRIVMEVFVDTVLLDWGSYAPERDAAGEAVIQPWIEGPDGAHLPFNRENALKVLTDLPELFRELRAESERLANFVAVTKEEDAKN